MLRSFTPFLSFLLILSLGSHLTSNFFCRADAHHDHPPGLALRKLDLPSNPHNLRHHHRRLGSNTSAAAGEFTLTGRQPEKRDPGSARLTYFKTGRGACGGFNTDNDFIVAMNTLQWDGGSHCYETITVSYNGKSTKAQIVDECMGCPFNAIDLSVGLFQFFANLGDGTIYGSWVYGAPAQPSPSPSPTPTVQKTTSVATVTSTTTSTSSTILQTSSSTTQIVTPATTATSTSAPILVPTAILDQINLILVSFGDITLQAPTFASSNVTSN